MFPTTTYGLGFADLGLPPSQVQSSSQTDLNSPEAFRHNIQLVQSHLMRLQSLARSASSGIEHAYYQGTNPLQTAEDVAALKQALHALVELLRTSGVGAFPLEPSTTPETRSEEVLVTEAQRTVQTLYERNKRIQDGASVIANLLNVAESGSQSQSQSQGQSQSQRR